MCKCCCLFFSNRKLDGGNVWWTFHLCKDFLLGDFFHFELHIIHGTNSFSLQLSSSSPVHAPYPLSLDICRFRLMCWLCLFQFGPEEHNSQVSPLLNAQVQVLLSRIPLVGRSLLLAVCQWQWHGLALQVLTTFHCARGIGHLHQFQCSSLLYVSLLFCCGYFVCLCVCLFVCCCFLEGGGKCPYHCHTANMELCLWPAFSCHAQSHTPSNENGCDHPFFTEQVSVGLPFTGHSAVCLVCSRYLRE